MKEIAEAAGVSISTVSLVLNGRDAGRVKAPLAALIREKADELGYTVNPLARSLRTCRTRILGFISEEVATTPYAGGIILGAQDAASTYGYMIITVSTDGKASEENEIATLKRYGVDGFFYSKMSNRIATVPGIPRRLSGGDGGCHRCRQPDTQHRARRIPNRLRCHETADPSRL